MKRLYRIGCGLFVQSICSIAVWIILGIITGNKNITNIFAITYPMQYVQMFCKCFFATGANISKEKNKNDNIVLSNLIIGTLFSFACFVLPCIFVDEYILFFGLNPEDYRLFVLYGFGFLFFQNILMYFMEKLYFEDKEKIALKHNVLFHLINIVLITSLILTTKNNKLSIAITLLVLFSYIIFLYITNFKKFKFSFNAYENFKYDSGNIGTAILMFIIYFFGLKTTFNAGIEYLVAFNLAALCTDSQYDANRAVSTAAKVDISKNRFEYKKSLKLSLFFTLTLIGSSFVMFFSTYYYYNVSLKLGLIYLMFEISIMLLLVFLQVFRSFCQLKVSSILTLIMFVSSHLLHLMLSVTLQTPFCLGIAQAGCFSLQLLICLVVRFKYCKIKNGELILNNSKNNL